MAKRKNCTPKKANDWTPAFLTALRNSANVRYACDKAGTCRRNAYDRKEKDAEFRAAWDEALEDACDALEAVARQRANTQSDTLLIFLLKAHRPGKYRENIKVDVGGTVTLQVVEEIVDGNYSEDRPTAPRPGGVSA